MWSRLILACAGLIGAMGVAAAAAAAQGPDGNNRSAIATHHQAPAPALRALGLAARHKSHLVAGSALAAGSLIFGADLMLRDWLGQGLFPGAAPVAGMLMVLAWVGLCVSAIWPGPKHEIVNKI